MTIDLGIVAAALIPTGVLSVIAFFVKRLLDQIDGTLKEMKTEQALHNTKSDMTHETQWKAINSTAAKVAKIEGRMDR